MSVNKCFISRLIKDIEESINTIMSYIHKPYDEVSDAEKYAIRYHIIVIAEALMALMMHIVRRKLGVTPETPIHALNILRDRGLVGIDEYRDVVGIIRLRNLLVHRYWSIDDRRIYENIIKDFHNIITFIRRLSRYVSEA